MNTSPYHDRVFLFVCYALALISSLITPLGQTAVILMLFCACSFLSEVVKELVRIRTKLYETR